MFGIFLQFKDEFTIAVNELEKKAQDKLINEYFKLHKDNRHNYMVAKQKDSKK